MEAPLFDITFPADFWTRYHASRTLTYRLWGTWLGCAFSIGIPMVFLVTMILPGLDLPLPFVFGIPILSGLLGGVIFLFVIMPLLQLYQLWSFLRKNRAMFGDQDTVLTPEGFSSRGETYNISLKWEAIYKAVETRKYFFLYTSSRTAFFIPKSRISTASDLEKLRSVLKTCLPGKSRLRSDAGVPGMVS